MAEFLLELEPHSFALAKALETGAWRPGAYRTFWVREPKLRLISAAPFADRVVHHAWVSIAEPYFERRFTSRSFSCRVGKGTHAALDLAQCLARTHRYVLRGDVQRFFPSLDHKVVLDSVTRVIADEKFTDVLASIVAGSNAQVEVLALFPGDDLLTLMERRRGLPIGNLTSQFLANVVLDRLDHFVLDGRGFGAYVRYCDDFLVFGDELGRLRDLRDALVEQLAGLRLRLHERKCGLHATCSPIPFLGFAVHGGKRRLLGPAVRRATRRLRRLARDAARGRRTREQLVASMRSWLAHAAHASPSALPERVLEHAGLAAPRPWE